MLLKEKSQIVLIKKNNGVKEKIAELPYEKKEVYLNLQADTLTVQFHFGESPENLIKIGESQSMVVLAESQLNKFNGTGVGIYATSNGHNSKNIALFDWFEYKNR